MTTFPIVDDHLEFRREARALLEAEGLVVVGEAADGRSALAQAAALEPDAALLDIGLPDLDGLEVASRLAGRQPAPGVVPISSRDGATNGSRLSGSPAAGLVRKDPPCSHDVADGAPDSRARRTRLGETDGDGDGRAPRTWVPRQPARDEGWPTCPTVS